MRYIRGSLYGIQYPGVVPIAMGLTGYAFRSSGTRPDLARSSTMNWYEARSGDGSGRAGANSLMCFPLRDTTGPLLQAFREVLTRRRYFLVRLRVCVKGKNTSSIAPLVYYIISPLRP